MSAPIRLATLAITLAVCMALAFGIGYKAGRADEWLDRPITCGTDAVIKHPVGRMKNAADHLQEDKPCSEC